MAFYDRSWMYPSSKAGRSGGAFLQGLEIFLAFADRTSYGGMIKCPCKDCRNSRWENSDTVAAHLHARGFIRGYEVWYNHGEEIPPDTIGSSSSATQSDMGQEENLMARMVLDAMGGDAAQFNNDETGVPYFHDTDGEPVDPPNPDAQQYLQLLQAANVPLHAKTNKTVLQHVAQLMHGKTQHGLSQKAFDYFLQLQLDAMPDEDAQKLPKNFYQVRRYLRKLRLPKIEIDVCVNHCVLFYKVWEDQDHCPYCGESRYTVNDSPTGSQTIPRKKLWYFPIADRLKRLFLCPKTAKDMTWHATCKGETEELIHPACGEAWKHFDRCHPDFAGENRNARVGICTDGFSPSDHASSHSIWPVFMTVYNLPPDMCMTEPFMFMAMIISGPKGPGQDLDVMLQPLIDDLESLWKNGTPAYDAHRKENFTLRVALMWTISDYPAYGMLSSWSTHGGLSCPYCMEKTSAFWLDNGRKFSFFDCHRKFLRPDHPFRYNTTAFLKGCDCHETAPERRTGYEMLLEVSKVPPVRPGKARGRRGPPGFGKEHNWVQASIFWQLPYWYTNLVRHNLDVMHVEKNVFDNVFYTLLDDPAKTKDNLNARKDLQIHTNRRPLYPQVGRNDEPVRPKATYTVTREQKQMIFEWVHSLRFPDGYASKISNCFNRNTLKVSNMKSHDCHIFLQRLLTIAFADFLPRQIWHPLAELSIFFRKLCSPRILASEMAVLEVTIVETICKLEKIFPPAFFDSMEHLTIHLPYEARVCGPVQYRWMYPFERRMHSLKEYVKNPNRPEGCIAEAYLHSEVTNFCALYFEHDIDHWVNRLARNEVRTTDYSEDVISVFRNPGRRLGKARSRPMNDADRAAAHLYVLLNCQEVEPYLSQFDSERCVGLNDIQRQMVRATDFPAWFKYALTTGVYPESQSLVCLASEPRPRVQAYNGYIVNGFRFHIESHGRRGTSNSGICVRGISGADADPENYYGTLESIVELDYHGFSIVMFQCRWYDTLTPNGVWSQPEYGLVEVNPNRRLQVNEPFILATQASQVYYTLSPGNHLRSRNARRGWLSVVSTRARHVIERLTNPEVASTDDENEPPNQQSREYQDDTVPRLRYDPYAITDEEVQLATGQFEYFPDEPAEAAPNQDEGIENFSSDEYGEDRD